MPKNLEGTKSSDTKENPTSMLELDQPKSYDGTDEEKELAAFVGGRFTKMLSTRTQKDRMWQMYQMQFEAQWLPYTDGRSRSNVPLEWAIIELFVAEAVSRRSIPVFTALGETDVVREEVIKRVWEYDKVRYDREEEIYKSEYITAMFGTCPYFNGFESKARIIKDPDIDDNGELTFKSKLLKDAKIVMEVLDIRDVYVDERVNDYKKANDCIYIQYVTPEELKSLDKAGGWKNIEFVGTSTKANQAYWTEEERGRNNTGLVELMHYWNKQSDKYVVLANRKIIVKDSFIPYAHKDLPITMRQYGYNPQSIYGRGLCEALLMFKSEINTLKEMIMDNVKRSNNSMFAIGGGLTFDGDSFGFNNTLVKFEGQLNDANFRELRGIPPNSAVFEYLQELLREIAVFVGIDPSSIIGEASSTAFETAVRQESSLKRVNVVLQNRDIALKQVYRKHMKNLMQYFPVKTAKGLFEINDEGEEEQVDGENKYPTILLENEKFIDNEFVQLDGRFPFEVKPEYIRGEIDIEVSTNFNAPTLKSLKRENLSNFVKVVNEITTAIQMNPALQGTIKIEDFIKQAAFDYDVDLDSLGGMSDTLSKQKDDIINKVNMLSGINPEDTEAFKNAAVTGESPTPPVPTDMSNTGTEIASSGSITPPSTPTTPNISNIGGGSNIMAG